MFTFLQKRRFEMVLVSSAHSITHLLTWVYFCWLVLRHTVFTICIYVPQIIHQYLLSVWHFCCVQCLSSDSSLWEKCKQSNLAEFWWLLRICLWPHMISILLQAITHVVGMALDLVSHRTVLHLQAAWKEIKQAEQTQVNCCKCCSNIYPQNFIRHHSKLIFFITKHSAV